jgi:RNA polymerase sigma-70 factor (ECF subfamily)
MSAPTQVERFQTLVEEHKRILYKICNIYCLNPDDRDDLAQEIVVQLWQSFDRFDPHYRFSTWMSRIALNVAISYYRRESTRARHVICADERLLEAIEDTTGQSDDIRLLYQFIGNLDPLNKALVLLYLEGYSYHEIADVLGISETNVATKISRLKRTLQQEFSATEAA